MSRILHLPSFRWFLAGIAPWALALILLPFLAGWSRYTVAILFGGLGALGTLTIPCLLAMGMRVAWTEMAERGRIARISRWINLVGLAAYLGLVAHLSVLFLRHEFGLLEGVPWAQEKTVRHTPALRDSNPSAQLVLLKVLETYGNLNTYRSEGTVVVSGNENGVGFRMATTFRMRLKKPNFYIISASGHRGGSPVSGTLWNNGKQPFFYCGEGWEEGQSCFFKLDSDLMNLVLGGWFTLGASRTVPEIFFPDVSILDLSDFYASDILPDAFANRAWIERTEMFLGEPCYVLKGPAGRGVEATYWISQRTLFILQSCHTYDSRKAEKDASEIEKQGDVWHSTTMTYTKRSTPDLRNEDFRFTPARGAVPKVYPLPSDPATEGR